MSDEDYFREELRAYQAMREAAERDQIGMANVAQRAERYESAWIQQDRIQQMQALQNQQAQRATGLQEQYDRATWHIARSVSAEEHVKLTERVARLEALLDKVCVEHEDCCASLLAHACKKTTPQPSKEEK